MRKIYNFIVLSIVLSCTSKTIKSEEYMVVNPPTINKATLANESNGCENIDVNTEIWANETYLGKRKYQRSHSWSEYDPNTVDKARKIPDTIFIQSKLWDQHLIRGEFKAIHDLYISVSIQIKYGQSGDCINVLNPNLTSEVFLLKDFAVTNKDIINAFNKTSYYKLGPLAYNLKETLRKYKINGFNGLETPQFLNQIVVKTYIGLTNGEKRCSFEYCQPMCTSIPATIIKSE